MSDTDVQPVALRCAEVLVDGLVAGGVRHVVLAPGSRSAPLAYAALAAARAGRIRLHVRLDERSAGFVALGLAKAGRRPVAVVTTSGTAVANLHPAVLEASEADVPLVLLTADRPGALQHTGANQTTVQAGIFGVHVRGAVHLEVAASQEYAWRFQLARLLALAAGTRSRRPGPVQLDVALPEPLAPRGASWVETGSSAERRRHTVLPAADPDPEPVALPGGPATVVVAGDLDPSRGRRLAAEAEQAGVPLFAEPSSNARRGATAIATYRLLLDGDLASGIERVVVVGHPTLSRPVNRLLTRSDVEVVVVSERPDWYDPGWQVDQVAGAVRLPPADPAWTAAWQQADVRVTAAVRRRLAAPAAPTQSSGVPLPSSGPVGSGPVPSDPVASSQAASSQVASGQVAPGAGRSAAVLGPSLAAVVWAALPDEALLVAGASQPIRDLDLAAIRARPPQVYANRGLAGIDGTVSTAWGVALATGRPVHVLLGDLTFLHDAGGLLAGRLEERPDLRIVVASDGGGSIFAGLEHGRPELAEAYERVFGTPQAAELGALARGYGASYRRIDDLDELRVLLDAAPSGVEVIEVGVDRSGRRGLEQELAELGR